MRKIYPLALLLLIGCLEPGPGRDRDPAPGPGPTPPVVQKPALAVTLTTKRTEQRDHMRDLAKTIANQVRQNGLTPEQQGEAWNTGVTAIDAQANAPAAAAIKEALKNATTAAAQADVWDTIAKGYEP